MALALAGSVVVFAPHAAQADPAAPQSAADCRAITDFTLRGQCWDALDREGVHDQQVVKKRQFGLGAHPPAAAAIVVPKPKAVRAQRVKPENSEVNSLTMTIASVGDTPLGRILLTSTDGAVWEQTDGDAVGERPSPGDTFKVSKGAVGGYLCNVTRWQAVRCQRDK
jgi:hypothetical protein